MISQNWKQSSNCVRRGLIIIFVSLTLVLHAQSAFPKSSVKKERFEIPLLYYQIAQLYGPGMSPSGKEGLHTRMFHKPVGRIGLVIVHPWNLGEPDGPYPFDPNTRIPGQAGDWVPRAHHIIADKIKPVLEAAREAKVAVFHLAQNLPCVLS